MVIGFGAAAGEDDFLGAGTDQGGDLFAGGFNGGAGLLAEGVDGRGIAEVAGKVGKHGVEDFGLDGRGGVVIEVYAFHGDALRILPIAGRVAKGERKVGVHRDTAAAHPLSLGIRFCPPHPRGICMTIKVKELRTEQFVSC